MAASKSSYRKVAHLKRSNVGHSFNAEYRIFKPGNGCCCKNHQSNKIRFKRVSCLSRVFIVNKITMFIY